jgi:hypothetical protein
MQYFGLMIDMILKQYIIINWLTKPPVARPPLHLQLSIELILAFVSSSPLFILYLPSLCPYHLPVTFIYLSYHCIAHSFTLKQFTHTHFSIP